MLSLGCEGTIPRDEVLTQTLCCRQAHHGLCATEDAPIIQASIALGKRFLAAHREGGTFWEVSSIAAGEDSSDIFFVAHVSGRHCVCTCLRDSDVPSELVRQLYMVHGSFAIRYGPYIPNHEPFAKALSHSFGVSSDIHGTLHPKAARVLLYALFFRRSGG
jgi:hypothetical protein